MPITGAQHLPDVVNHDFGDAMPWLSGLRDEFFRLPGSAPQTNDAASALENLERNLAMTFNALRLVDYAVMEEEPMDVIRAALAGAMALLTMAAGPFGAIKAACELAERSRPEGAAGSRETPEQHQAA